MKTLSTASPRDVDTLAEYCEDEDIAVRRLALIGLEGHANMHPGVKRCALAAMDSEHRDIRAQGLTLLLSMNSAPPVAVQALASVVAEGRPDEAARAATLLASMGAAAEPALPALVARATSRRWRTDSDPAQQASEATLAGLAAALPGSFEAGAFDEDESAAKVYVTSLARATPENTQPRSALLRLSRSPQAGPARLAVTALGEAPPTGATIAAVLARARARDGVTQTAVAALQGLATRSNALAEGLNTQAAAAVMTELIHLHGAAPPEVTAAATALLRALPATVIPFLIAALRGTEPELRGPARLAVIQALGERGGAAAAGSELLATERWCRDRSWLRSRSTARAVKTPPPLWSSCWAIGTST